jgi:hypothetical protein
MACVYFVLFDKYTPYPLLTFRRSGVAEQMKGGKIMVKLVYVHLQELGVGNHDHDAMTQDWASIGVIAVHFPRNHVVKSVAWVHYTSDISYADAVSVVKRSWSHEEQVFMLPAKYVVDINY